MEKGVKYSLCEPLFLACAKKPGLKMGSPCGELSPKGKQGLIDRQKIKYSNKFLLLIVKNFDKFIHGIWMLAGGYLIVKQFQLDSFFNMVILIIGIIFFIITIVCTVIEVYVHKRKQEDYLNMVAKTTIFMVVYFLSAGLIGITCMKIYMWIVGYFNIEWELNFNISMILTLFTVMTVLFFKRFYFVKKLVSLVFEVETD